MFSRALIKYRVSLIGTVIGDTVSVTADTVYKNILEIIMVKDVYIK